MKQKLAALLYRYNLTMPFSERRVLLFAGDVSLLLAAAIITLWSRTLLQGNFTIDLLISGGQAIWIIPLALMWLIVAAVNHCYDLQLANHPRTIIPALLLTTFITWFLYLLIFFVIGRSVSEVGPSLLAENTILANPIYRLPRIIPVSFLFIACLLVIIWRIGYIQLSTKYPLRRRVIIVGAGKSGRALMQTLQQPLFGYEILGFIDDDLTKRGDVIAGLPLLGNRDTLVQIIEQNNVNEIILAITQEIHADLYQILMNCYEQGLVIKPMSLFYEELMERIPVEHLGQHSLLIPFWSNMNLPTFYRLSKRVIDVLTALLGLTVLFLLYPFIAMSIYIGSPGPIMYTQERLGKGGKHFRLHKFRSMIPDAEQKGEAVWAAQNDRRVTKVGKFLRRSRLDELPQLYNVLKGEMSLVGPRPERPEFINQLQQQIPFYRTRLSVKPGLTGWAQVQYHYGNSMTDSLIKLEYDLYYIKYRSVALDLLIILRTIKVMLMFKGT